MFYGLTVTKRGAKINGKQDGAFQLAIDSKPQHPAGTTSVRVLTLMLAAYFVARTPQ